MARYATSSLKVETIDGGTRIARRWLNAGLLLQVPVLLFWNYLFYVGGAALLLTAPTFTLDWLMVPLAIGYALVTFSGNLSVLRAVVNRTTVRVTAETLTVTHGPIALIRRHHLKRGQLSQLVCVQAAGWLGRPSWDLIAIKRDGRRVRLIQGRPLDELQYIERAAEQALGIVDAPPSPAALQPALPFFRRSITEGLLPIRLESQAQGDRLVLTWPWFNISAIVVVGLVGVWLFTDIPDMAATLWARWMERKTTDFALSIDALVPALVQVASATVLVYLLLAFSMNRTVVSVIRGGTLAVRHGPLPLLRGVTVSVGEVHQLFVQKVGIAGLEKFGARAHVRALLADGRRVTLAKAPTVEHALELELQIEQWLTIKDAPVDDEPDRPDARSPVRSVERALSSLASGIQDSPWTEKLLSGIETVLAFALALWLVPMLVRSSTGGEISDLKQAGVIVLPVAFVVACVIAGFGFWFLKRTLEDDHQALRALIDAAGVTLLLSVLMGWRSPDETRTVTPDPAYQAIVQTPAAVPAAVPTLRDGPEVHVAVTEGDVDRIASALAQGGDLEARNAAGRTALMLAVERAKYAPAHIEVVRYLLDRGANVNARTTTGASALTLAGANRPVIELLAERGADPDVQAGPGESLWWSMRYMPAEDVMAIADKFPRIGQPVSPDGKRWAGPLHLWADLNQPQLVEYFLRRGVDPRAVDVFGRTALHSAVDHLGWDAEPTMAVIKLLLDAGADVNARDNANRTALMMADRIEVQRLMEERGATVDTR